ncbi:hypothetical protein [Polymorphospora lycopeni]|uniref:Transposase n=1 Tax=Polymorphospora lycopeni TaxID=3140240 RepID=A0ABV5CRG6_9ACTN
MPGRPAVLGFVDRLVMTLANLRPGDQGDRRLRRRRPTLWCGSYRPGRMHDATAARTEGIETLLHAYPQAKALVDTGYQA